MKLKSLVEIFMGYHTYNKKLRNAKMEINKNYEIVSNKFK